MILAKQNDQLVKPTVGAKAICPSCKEEVIAKCGNINIWHWSHKNDTECDSWSEPETEWHYNWKMLFPISCVEVTKGIHRADVEWLGRVIEFQHSNISSEDIKEREVFYGNMFWVVDASEFENNFIFYENSKYCRWKWFRKSWWFASKKVFLQTSDGNLLLVTRWTNKGFFFDDISLIKFKKEYLNLKVL